MGPDAPHGRPGTRARERGRDRAPRSGRVYHPAQGLRYAVRRPLVPRESRPAITLSWIRELPSLGAVARPVQRTVLTLLSDLLIDLSASPGFRRADLPPLTPPLAVILLGGLRELTAMAVEDGRPVREIVEPAVDAAVALLGPRH